MPMVIRWQGHPATPRPDNRDTESATITEPLPQRENGRDSGSDQRSERKRPGAAGRETGSDTGGWHRRRRTLTADRLGLGLRGSVVVS